jgi:hypothetical protein
VFTNAQSVTVPDNDSQRGVAEVVETVFGVPVALGTVAAVEQEASVPSEASWEQSPSRQPSACEHRVRLPTRTWRASVRPTAGDHTDAGKKTVHVYRDYSFSTAYSTAVS